MKLLKKMLIWVACIFSVALIQILIQQIFHIIFGGLPVLALYGLTFYVARSLCKKVNQRSEEPSAAMSQETVSHPEAQPSEASTSSHPEEEAEIITTAALEAQAAPASPVKVSWKAPSTKAPSAPRPKRTGNKLLVPVCALSALLLLSLGGNRYQHLRNNSRSAQIQALTTQLKDADAEIAVLENRAEDMEENRNYYRTLAYERGLEADEYRIVSDFFYSHIAFVLDDGTDLYHSYCCPYIQEQETYSFWAYNVDAAKASGYQACPLCADNFD